ncbi:hypothetical protein Y032_0029g1917 [Ancylostoma ceylanicum]|uniref:Uncharacterized protein n=1 Tax=Ancylostoma ceylanicum TaxID=53326 RepID=A0A016UR19_9BILA|nr:hypothetical protein Y032_0029g1917 [Ancylostoma ceylanicum]
MEGNEVMIQIEHVSRQHFPMKLYTPAGARDRKNVNFVKNFIFMNLANEASPGIFLLVSDCLLATEIGEKFAAGNERYIGITVNPFFTTFLLQLTISVLPLSEKLLIGTTRAKHAIMSSMKSHFTQIH